MAVSVKWVIRAIRVIRIIGVTRFLRDIWVFCGEAGSGNTENRRQRLAQ
jgi:hypothetical protein